MRGVIPELDSITYIPCRDQWCCSNAVKDWIVLHSIESGESGSAAENCANYFKNPGNRVASTQFVVDNNSTIRCAGWNMRIAGAVGANSRGWHIEQAGFAGQDEGWLDEYSMDMILGQTAPLVAALCLRDNIPVRFVDAAGLRRGERGITTHHECWKAFGGDVRTDPGAMYPMDMLLWEVEMLLDGKSSNTQPTTPPEDPDMTVDEYMKFIMPHHYEAMNQRKEATVKEVTEAVTKHVDAKVYAIFEGMGVSRDDIARFIDERTDAIQADVDAIQADLADDGV
jgi:hypothetical protein